MQNISSRFIHNDSNISDCICFGGNNTGTFHVTFNSIPSSFGDSVFAKVEYVTWLNKDTPVSGPTTVSNTIYKISNGTIKVPVDVTNSFYGYRVYITPINNPVAIEDVQEIVPGEFVLSQNYPNPFNPSTTISYQLPEAGNVTLKIYNILGDEVATLVNEFKNAGFYNSQFSILHYQLTSGVYFYFLKSNNFVATKLFVLVK